MAYSMLPQKWHEQQPSCAVLHVKLYNALFEIYTIAIFGIVIVGTAWGLYGARDTLHPLVYLMPMAGFIYVYMPVTLYIDGGLLYYFTYNEVTFVQGLNLAGIAALALGCYLSSCRSRSRSSASVSIDKPYWRRRLWQFALVLGSISFLAYAYQIANVGGFIAAYDTAKGGGWAESGYIRDATLLSVPAIAFLYLSRRGETWSTRHWLLAGLLAVPLLLHGLLGARRGPTFLALATLAGGWYLAQRMRPRVITIAAGGAGVGLLLLLLVTFRNQIYLGSNFLQGEMPPASEMVEQALENRTHAHLENEFMYGTYVVHYAREENGFYWGKRYLSQVLIRPIPSSIWPNKYEDVGIGAITENIGLLGPGGADAHPDVPQGAAPGFVADIYAEWAWGAIPFIFLVGWLYGFGWQQCVRWGGIWTVHYTVLMALSVFLIAQSFYAPLSRYLLMVVPGALLWQWGKADCVRKMKHKRRIEARQLRGA